MILFDCSDLRHPYCGIYTYIDSLANSLYLQGASCGADIGFYVPESFRGAFGETSRYKKMLGLHRHLFHPGKDVSLFHVTTQFSKFFPNIFRGQILLTVHDLNYMHGDFPEHTKEKYRRRTLRTFEKADRIVTISEFARQDILENIDTKGKKVEMVYNGITPFTGKLTPPSRIPDRPFLLSVGRVATSKNIHTLPCLLAETGYSLVIIGRLCDEAEVRQINEEARKWGVEDRITFTGAISESTKHWYFEHCEAFAMPSLCEGFGIPALEAMLHRKPVFLSDRTSLPEIAGEHAYYFNHDFESRAMQEEFMKGMDDFSKGGKDIEAMVAHAQSFSWENAAKNYIGIYKDMLQ